MQETKHNNFGSNGTDVAKIRETKSSIAFKDTKMRADRGDERAQYALGHKYSYGDGVSGDYKLALKYYKMSADQGNPYAQRLLGKMYRYGIRVHINFGLAYKYSKMSAEQGIPSAVDFMEECEKSGIKNVVRISKEVWINEYTDDQVRWLV